MAQLLGQNSDLYMGSNASQDFARIKRLAYIVHGPEFQSSYTVTRIGFGRKEHHGLVGETWIVFELRTDLVTIFSRHHYIEQE